MFPTIDIGPFVFPTATLTYIIGAWLLLGLIERAAGRLGMDSEPVYAVGVAALFGGVVGARLVFVAQYWPAYQDNLLGILWPINSGYHLWGGLIIGGAAAFFYGRMRQLEPGPTLDALAPSLILGLLVVSLADFLAGPGAGTFTRMPWAVTYFGATRHPVQLYEIVVALIALAGWWLLSPRRTFPGQLFLATVSLYSGGRLLVDAFRDSTWLTAGGLRIVQIISLVALLVALSLLGYLADRAAERQSRPQP